MSENAENKALIHIAEDGEGNIEMHINGKGGDLVQILASVIDDDDNFKQMVELALTLVDMKRGAEANDEPGFLNPPTAEA